MLVKVVIVVFSNLVKEQYTFLVAPFVIRINYRSKNKATKDVFLKKKKQIKNLSHEMNFLKKT